MITWLRQPAVLSHALILLASAAFGQAVLAKLDTLPKADVDGPVNQHYGQRELLVLAPDGNLLAFGQANGGQGEVFVGNGQGLVVIAVSGRIVPLRMKQGAQVAQAGGRVQLDSQERCRSAAMAVLLVLVDPDAPLLGNGGGVDPVHVLRAGEQPGGDVPDRVSCCCGGNLSYGMPNTELIRRLRAALRPENVLSAPSEMIVYDCDAFTVERRLPLAVVFPRCAAHVSQIVRICADHGCAVVARGAGTGLAGGCTPPPNAVVIMLTRMPPP